MIVKTYKFGNTTVHIADDRIKTDPKEIEEVLNRFHAAGWAIVEEMQEKGEKA